jgi:LysM repeat protein
VQQDKMIVQYHTVERGETLCSIARRYNTTVDKIRKLNGISSSESKVLAGKKLKVKQEEQKR